MPVLRQLSRVCVGLLTLSVLVVAPPARAATPTTWSIAQPGAPATGCDGVRASLAINAAGNLSLGATRDCATVLEPAPVGVVTTTADLTTGLTFVSRTERAISYRYTTVTGKNRDRQRTATESRFVFARGAVRFTVFVRVSADGITYRYEFPNAATITGEASSFQLPSGSPAFLAAYSNKYESSYGRSTAAGAATGEFNYPALFQVGSSWALLSESDVDGRYSGGRLVHTTGSGRYTVGLADPQVSFPAGFVTPWRTAIIGSLSTVVTSTLNDDVAPPSRIADPSWITPGVSAWSWLDGGRATQASLSRQRAYVDYAARQGWEYVIVDDGWAGVTWMPELVAYARSKNVRIIVWYRYTDVDTAAERTAQFGRIAGWGVAGVKLDFMDSDSQERNRWYDATLASTAQHRLVVNFHGSTIPHGIQRTWPHVLTLEAVKGEESNSRSLQHITALPFTRNVVGSMDYTPQSFQRSRPHSDAAELALAVVYESGLHVFGGSISAYQSRPVAERYLRRMPTVWDQTRLVSGDPTSGVTIARRTGDRWFLGAVLPGAARTISVPTSFLATGQWLVETVTDGPGGLTRTSRTIAAGDRLSIAVVANGGFAAKLCPAVAGTTTCDS
ncbi:MAG TPA: glycoside hydrolase family 97 catalytic domain-containing protein [Catenuloplanes sp.]